MSGNNKRHGGTIGWLLVLGVSALLAVAVAPALAGTANAAPIQAASASSSTQWAYGGNGSSNGSTTIGNTTLSWSATFGWTVIYTATNTSNSTVQLEEQRTVGISLTAKLTAPLVSATYTYHGTETDAAFVNLTDEATVWVNGAPVRAVGVNNESIGIQAAVDQSVQVDRLGHSHSAYLNVSGTAQGSVQFAPALGIIPLNLTGVTQWNSSATATPAASWNIDYNWADLGWNGTTASGSGVIAGNWTVTGPISLTGYVVVEHHLWPDQQSRVAIVLVVQGPVDAYDGFILVPHGFDLFGGANQRFNADSMGAASVGSGYGQTLFVSNTARGPMVTAASTNFGATTTGVATLGQATAGPSPAASSTDPSATVYGNPMSVAQAQAENACLTNGCSASGASGPTSGLIGIALIAVAVIAVVGTVSVVEWRAYARRRSQKGLVGGYGESWPNGVPPAGAAHAPAPSQGPSLPEAPRPPQQP